MCVFKVKLARIEVDAGKQFPPFLLLPGAGADLSLAWAPGTERRYPLPNIFSLENKYKSITAQLKDSLVLVGCRKDGGVGGWCKFACM